MCHNVVRFARALRPEARGGLRFAESDQVQVGDSRPRRQYEAHLGDAWLSPSRPPAGPSGPYEK